MERTNIRYVTPEQLGEPLDLSVVDVSFISLKIVLPAIKALLKPTGQVLCLMDADGISGLLHYAPGRAQCEIRHLAVRADCRGHGYAGRLLAMLEAKTGGQKCAVWARVGNAPAKHFYEKNQFQPDGWQSVVLRLG